MKRREEQKREGICHDRYVDKVNVNYVQIQSVDGA